MTNADIVRRGGEKVKEGKLRRSGVLEDSLRHLALSEFSTGISFLSACGCSRKRVGFVG